MKKKPVKQKRKPTIRQKLAFKKMAEKGRSMRQAILEAGYSEAVANAPSKLTSTQTWQDLLEKYLPDERLTEKHEELMEASAVDDFFVDPKLEDKEIYAIAKKAHVKVFMIQRGAIGGTKVYVSKADTATQRQALDMAYKLKGVYAAERLDLTSKGRQIKPNPDHAAAIISTLQKIRRNIRK
jgi:hypothetical protein